MNRRLPLLCLPAVLLSLALSLPLPAQLELSNQLLDDIESRHDSYARKRLEQWQILIEDSEELTDQQKLTAVNDFFNSRVMFTDDEILWGREDYWATPVETLAMGTGDCEDFSIAKYFTLRELGVEDDKMRLTYVKATELNQAHMVLTYYENRRATPQVLDNLIPEIRTADKRQDLVPVYSFNGSGLWLAKTRGEGERVGDSSRLSLWEDLKARMQREGAL